MKKHFSFHAIVFVVAFTSSVFGKTKEDDEFERYLKRIEALFSKISSKDMANILMTEEKRKLMMDLIKRAEAQEDSEQGKDGSFFIPKMPKELSDEEKEQEIKERVSKKYIGSLPSQIDDLIFYFANHAECINQERRPYNRLLIHGKPGTGKSHLFKVLAQELQVPHLIFSASFFADKYIGESSRRIRKAFDAAKKLNKPVMIFIDEIDALATKRTDGTHQEHRATLITLLTELQDLQDDKNIFVIAATNDFNALDPAIVDRFAGSVCEIKPLSKQERAALYAKYFAEQNIAVDQELLDRLADVTPSQNDFSNRDMEYIIWTAAFRRFAACKKNKEKCNDDIFPYIIEVGESTDAMKTIYRRTV